MKIFKKIAVLTSLFVFGGASLAGAVSLKEKKEIVKASESVQEAYFSRAEVEATGWCYFTVKGASEIESVTANTHFADSFMNNENVNFLDKVTFKRYGEEVKLRDVLVADSFYWNHWTRTGAISFQINPTFAEEIYSTRVGGKHDGNTITIYEDCVIPSPAFTGGAAEFSGYKHPTRAFFGISREFGISAQFEIIKATKITNVLRRTDREDTNVKTALWFGVDYATGYDETQANKAMNGIVSPYIYGNRVKINGKYIGEYASSATYSDTELIAQTYSNPWASYGLNELGLKQDIDLKTITFEKGLIIQDPLHPQSNYVATGDDLATFKSKIAKGYKLEETITFVRDEYGSYYADYGETKTTDADFVSWDSGTYFLTLNLTNHDFKLKPEQTNVQLKATYVLFYSLFKGTKLLNAAGDEVEYEFGSDFYHKTINGSDFAIRFKPKNSSDLSTVVKVVMPKGAQVPSFDYVNPDLTVPPSNEQYRIGVKGAFILSEETIICKSSKGFAYPKIVDAFVADNMHMTDYTEQLGWCKDSEHHYYSTAKAAFNDMPEAERALFLEHSDYTAAKERLVAWAAANGEVVSGTSLASGSNISSIAGDSTNTGMIVIVVLVSLIAIVGATIVLKKRKENN